MVLTAKGVPAHDVVSVDSAHAHDAAPSPAGRPHQVREFTFSLEINKQTALQRPSIPPSHSRAHLVPQHGMRLTICGTNVTLRPSAAFVLLGAWCGVGPCSSHSQPSCSPTLPAAALGSAAFDSQTTPLSPPQLPLQCYGVRRATRGGLQVRSSACVWSHPQRLVSPAPPRSARPHLALPLPPRRRHAGQPRCLHRSEHPTRSIDGFKYGGWMTVITSVCFCVCAGSELVLTGDLERKGSWKVRRPCPVSMPARASCPFASHRGDIRRSGTTRGESS